ncbi:hypothetical protein, partial [Pseudomonas aeruginosa]|uniref:hypothetical protein n=1 Tax=Pseudomonas aeruginosa TaxID=287 RepID=UPI001BAAC32B
MSAIWLIRPANKKRQRWSRDAAFYPSCCLPSSAKKIYHSRRQKEGSSRFPGEGGLDFQKEVFRVPKSIG